MPAKPNNGRQFGGNGGLIGEKIGNTMHHQPGDG
jgi:hypothetical protein